MKKQYDFSKARRGPLLPPRSRTTPISLHIDDELIDWFRKRVNENCGGDYGDLINHALREYVDSHPDGLDEAMRHALRPDGHANTKLVKPPSSKRKRAGRAT